MKRKLTLKCGLLSAIILISISSFSQNYPGPVGIGTTTPAYPLDVNGMGQFSGGTRIGNGPIGFYGDGVNYAVRAFNVANSGFYIQPYSGNATYFYVGQMGTYAGKVGIGTMTPKTGLEISWPGNDLLTLTSAIGGGGNTTNIFMDTYDVGAGPHISRIQALDNADYSANLTFSTKIPGSIANVLSERMRITSVGDVGIGTTDTKGYKLAVAGPAGIIAERIVIKKQVNWPDYVFSKNYNLRSLTSIKTYINHYNHLPDVPSAKEIGKDGLDISKTQAVLLRKIEELTLYVIGQSEEIKELRKKVNTVTTHKK